MNKQPSSVAPDVVSVLKFVAALAWRAKWLIGVASIVAAAVAFALVRADTVQVWTGKTTLTIGLSPTADYILQGNGPLTSTIDTPRSTVARISDPAFKNQVVSRAAFEPATAAVSRSLVSSSLRGIVLEGEREVAIELSAGSAADVQAAFRAIAAEIDRTHGEILKRRLQLLQSRIDEAKSRVALIETSNERLNDRFFNVSPDEKTQVRPLIFNLVPAASIPAWNTLQDRIERDTTLKELSEPSVLRLENYTFLMPRSTNALKASILAGLAMLAAMIVLTIVVNRPATAD